MSVPKPKRKTDPCPCGSDKQYRYCHGAQATELDRRPEIQRNPRYLFLWILLVGTPIAYASGLYFDKGAVNGGSRVWSEEHGHYHTVDQIEAEAKAAEAKAAAAPADGSAAAAPTPTAPPGPAPPGKEWNAAHGHWHDISGAAKATEPPQFNPSDGQPWDHTYELTRPEGDPPPNSTWSQAHGHWHENQ